MVDCRESVCLMCKVIWGLSCFLKNLSVFISSKKLFFLLKLTLHDTCAWRQYSLIYIGMSTMPKSIYKMCPIEALIIIYWDVKITKPFWATLNTEQRKAWHRSARRGISKWETHCYIAIIIVVRSPNSCTFFLTMAIYDFLFILLLFSSSTTTLWPWIFLEEKPTEISHRQLS